jgi:hypothetical protein
MGRIEEEEVRVESGETDSEGVQGVIIGPSSIT